MTEFLTAREYADVMKVTPRTVLKWIRAGDIPSVRVGRSIRIPASAVPVPQQVRQEEASA
jgi:excisionase family DNA binding protein